MSTLLSFGWLNGRRGRGLFFLIEHTSGIEVGIQLPCLGPPCIHTSDTEVLAVARDWRLTSRRLEKKIGESAAASAKTAPMTT